MRRAQQESLKEKIKRVKLLILDVDGVLTDGRIIYDSEGRQLRLFDAQDGTGILLLAAAGIKTIMVTILPSRAIECRAKDLRVEELYQGVKQTILTRVAEDVPPKPRCKCKGMGWKTDCPDGTHRIWARMAVGMSAADAQDAERELVAQAEARMAEETMVLGL